MRFRCVHLLARDLPALTRFYRDVLELPLLAAGAREVSFAAGSSRLTFAACPANQQPCYHFAFDLPEHQFTEAKAWVAARTPLISLDGNDTFDFSNWNAHAFYFFDPAGNIVEGIARHDLPNASTSPFTGAQICHISEIGLVTPAVAKTATALKRALGIEAYRNTEYENFAAIGDAHGLFIVVAEGRAWYPVGPEAGIFATAIEIAEPLDGELVLGDLPYTIRHGDQS